MGLTTGNGTATCAQSLDGQLRSLIIEHHRLRDAAKILHSIGSPDADVKARAAKRVQQEIINKSYELKHFITLYAITARDVKDGTAASALPAAAAEQVEPSPHCSSNRQEPPTNGTSATLPDQLQLSAPSITCDPPGQTAVSSVVEVRPNFNAINDCQHAPNALDTANETLADEELRESTVLGLKPSTVPRASSSQISKVNGTNPSTNSSLAQNERLDTRQQQAVFLANFDLCTIDRHQEVVAKTLARSKQRRRRSTANPLFSAKAVEERLKQRSIQRKKALSHRKTN